MKNTKYIVKTSKSNIPIDEDEIEKVVIGLNQGQIVVLRQGILNPSYFDTIVQDSEAYKTYVEDKKYDIREGKITELPKYRDMFAGLKENLEKYKKLTDKNNDQRRIG